MADNAYKRQVVNDALIILNAGKTGQAGILFTSITDEEFADWTTVSASNHPDKRLICSIYERVLKMVLEDITPDFACFYADLGHEVAANKAYGGWDYLFELPSDYLCMIGQIDEGSKGKQGQHCEVIQLANYSHVVVGTDDQAYYCSTSHTSVDDSSDGQPPDDDGNSNWTLYSTDGSLGVQWYESMSYKYNSTGKLLASNIMNNKDGDGAYIKYVAYEQAGQSDEPQYYPAHFSNALSTRLAAEIALDSKDYERRRRLIEEYERLAKYDYRRVEYRHKQRVKPKTILEARNG